MNPRTPEGRPAGGPRALGPAGDGRAQLEELRDLLLQGDRERVAALEAAGVDPARLAEALADGIRLAESEGDDVARALAPTIEAGLFRSARRDPGALADAIHPALGPAIRSMIQATLRQSLEKLNVALENSLSPQGLRWRMQAARTGQSFSEVVLLNTLVYRVESVVLVHRDTSLVLAEVHAEDAPERDSDLVAGMLGAIEDFAADSLGGDGGDGDRLHEIEFGDRTLILARGPSAMGLLVVRGNPPQSLAEHALDAVAELHVDYGEEFVEFGGEGDADGAALAQLVTPKLEDLLESEARAREPNRLLRIVPVAIAAALVAWLLFAGVSSYRSARRVDAARTALAQVPGIVVIDGASVDGRPRITGLRDPLSEDPAAVLRRAGVEADLELSHHVSLDPALVLRRAAASLDLARGTHLTLGGGELRVWGVAPASAEAARIRSLAPMIPGVLGVRFRP